jgi:serine/threonine-protein kinase
VAVSGGLPNVQVPNVIGFDVERATTVLSQLGLSAEQRSEVNERPLGTVLGIQPEPGQTQPVPSRVLLIVSAGPPPGPPTPPADSTAPPDSLVFESNDS